MLGSGYVGVCKVCTVKRIKEYLVSLPVKQIDARSSRHAHEEVANEVMVLHVQALRDPAEA